MNKKFLQEAIADAEQVRETAIANAKMQLEEAITPTIKDEIVKALNEASDPTIGMNPQDFADVTEGKESVDYKSSGVGSSGESGSVKSGEDLSDKMGPAEGESPSDGPAPTYKSSDVGNDGETSGDSERGAAKNKGSDTKEVTLTDLKEEEELEEDEEINEGLTEDLEDIIRELQAEVDQIRGQEYGDEEFPVEDPAMAGGDEFDMDAGGEFDVGGGDAEMDLDMGAGEAPEADPFAGGEEEDEMEEDFDLESILREIEAELTEETEAELAQENARLKEEIGEYRGAVLLLRTKLNEVNLLNAKLLYTNKLFKSKAMTNEDKVHVIETFDLATTLREVKLLYATLCEAKFGNVSKTKSSPTKVVVEGLASKPSGKSTAPEEKLLNENTELEAFRARNRELAGIQVLEG